MLNTNVKRTTWDWYQGGKEEACLNPAREAFNEAVSVFNLPNLAQQNVDSAKFIEQIQQIILASKTEYDKQHKGHKISKWLSKLSSRVVSYGNVLDVLVQHHPEFVSLAWGAMKILFILVQNHAKSVHSFSKALSEISDALPRIRLASLLYPTERMKQCVSEQYALIIQFFIQAQNWFQQSKIHHAWNAFAKPFELSYADLVDDIRSKTVEVENLATAGSRAEQRDMHLEQKLMHTEIQTMSYRQRQSDSLLLDLQCKLASIEALASSTYINTDTLLTDLQLNQVMDFLGDVNQLDRLQRLQYYSNSSSRGRLTSKSPSSNKERRFWMHKKLFNWDAKKQCSLVMVKGGYGTRFEVKRHFVQIIEQLREAQIPIIWTLKTSSLAGSNNLSVIGVLKDLVHQALQLSLTTQTERTMSLSCARFRAAETIEHWLDLLGNALRRFSWIYIAIDLEAIDLPYLEDDTVFSWFSTFLKMFKTLGNQKGSPVVKVLLVSYGSAHIHEPRLAKFSDLIVSSKQLQSGTMRAQPGDSKRRLTGRGRGRLS